MTQLISTKKSYIDPRDLPSVDRGTLRRIVGYLRAYRGRAVAIVVLLVVIAALNLIPPLLIREVVDVAIPGRNIPMLLVLCGAMILGPFLGGLIQVFQKVLTTKTGEQIMLDLRVALFGHLQRQPLSYFTAARPGEAMSRVLNDVQGAGGAVSSTMVTLADNAINFTLAVAAAFFLDWRLALLALVLMPLYVLPTRTVGRKRKVLKRQSQGLMAELTGVLSETLSISGAQLIKVFGTERVETDRVRRKGVELMRVNVAQTMMARRFNLMLTTIEAVGPALLFLGGGYLVMHGEAELGTVVAFVALLKKIYSPASALALVHVDVVTSYAYFERVFGVLDLVPTIRDEPGARALEECEGQITFDQVSFSYPGGADTLSDLNFTVQPGQTMALVGPSGAGKSTLAALVPRLHEVTAGAVLVDGWDVRELTQESLRDHIAVVQQETYLLHDTILENLRYARRDASLEEIQAAARDAQIHDVITALPDGYLTVVGDRGHRLSGGERQRVAIARAILKDPRILILDEATSSLDSHAEARVQAAFDRLSVGRTSIVIAHRLSTIRNADVIAVLDAGKIVESGSHEELLAADGSYARLYRRQRQRGSDVLTDMDIPALTDPEVPPPTTRVQWPPPPGGYALYWPDGPAPRRALVDANGADHRTPPAEDAAIADTDLGTLTGSDTEHVDGLVATAGTNGHAANGHGPVNGYATNGYRVDQHDLGAHAVDGAGVDGAAVDGAAVDGHASHDGAAADEIDPENDMSDTVVLHFDRDLLWRR